MKRPIHCVAAVLSIGAVISGGVYSFGSRTTDDSYWGKTTVRRRWGIEREVVIDRNRDGRPDVRITYPGHDRTIGTHDRPSRLRIDNDLDGKFEIEWRDGLQATLSITSARGTAVYRGREAGLPNARIRILSRQELGLQAPERSGT